MGLTFFPIFKRKRSKYPAILSITTFPTFNALSKLEKYFEVLNEHYSKVNEENKKFANPEQHISDKYFNKKSPYYVKGLTKAEREVCADQEWRALKKMGL